MPKENLPTFNSNAIEMNMHKIKGLSEQFVYFNDDMFLTNKVFPEDFFKDGLPCDACVFAPIMVKPGDNFFKKVCNDIVIINKHFNFKKCIEKNNWLYRYWQFASGKFMPRNPKMGKYIDIMDENLCYFIERKKYKITCINDSEQDMDFKIRKNEINASFDKILPYKSKFER